MNRRMLSAIALTLIGALAATGWAQERSPDDLSAGIAYHERMLEQRAAQVERVRTAARKTAGELAEVERKIGLERGPEERQRLQVQRENLRLRLLRRTILQDRAELKQQELAEHIEILKQEKASGTPLTPAQSRQKRRDFLARRLHRAERLMQTIRELGKTAVSEREKAGISRLLKEQEALLAEIKRAITKLDR